MELLNHVIVFWVCLFVCLFVFVLVFGGNSILLFIVGVPIYILNRSVLEFLFSTFWEHLLLVDF